MHFSIVSKSDDGIFPPPVFPISDLRRADRVISLAVRPFTEGWSCAAIFRFSWRMSFFVLTNSMPAATGHDRGWLAFSSRP